MSFEWNPALRGHSFSISITPDRIENRWITSIGLPEIPIWEYSE